MSTMQSMDPFDVFRHEDGSAMSVEEMAALGKQYEEFLAEEVGYEHEEFNKTLQDAMRSHTHHMLNCGTELPPQIKKKPKRKRSSRGRVSSARITGKRGPIPTGHHKRG